MKIAVFSKEKVSTFQLPNEVVGSFSFDISSSEQKIVNITSEDNKWILKQTSEIQLISGNQFVQKVALANNSFYTLRKKDANYLIYTYENNKINLYNYNKDVSLTIGNGNGASIDYNCPFLKTPITIGYENDKIILKKDTNTLVYINKKILLQNSIEINYGDEIDVFGLKLNFYNESLLAINNVPGLIVGADISSHLTNYTFSDTEELKEIEVEENPLYGKNDYYSKSPRLRRMIEEKKFNLDPPPNAEKGSGEKMPMILVAGPMITMGMSSVITTSMTLYGIFAQGNSIKNSIPQLLISGCMLASTIVWPLLTSLYNKTVQKRSMKKALKSYAEKLDYLEKTVGEEQQSQRVILAENLSTIEECIKNIESRSMNFWDKRMEQNDFLLARVGIGIVPSPCCIVYNGEFAAKPKDLEKKARELVEKYQYMDQMPMSYSFYTNMITAIMGSEKKQFNFVNNILLQFLTYYSYDDLKIVVFTSEENESNWEYLKYLNHNFSNDKSIRFYASNPRSINNVTEYLNIELNNRIEQANGKDILAKPHYLIISDDYERIKRTKFIKTLVELDNKIGFSMIIIENKLAKLPSKCNNFITLGNKNSDILKNTYETQEHTSFQDEIHYDLNMKKITKPLANIPIEFENDSRKMPDSIDFLQMEQVGNIEQLNILNRWRNNDSINTLKAEVGVDENGEPLFLDIHERYHGPHGLIAGMTGSGKSEFIITYILSLAINYSPEDVSFILIDYKGGGLAYAFENKQKGIALPHLAGTITNLDKAEMDRTLVSINSEIKRRQKIFNEARDMLGESTIDIYKYQRFYKEGRINQPVPHLLIICDEFAELKSQQPDFMDNLISVARIGRSLGVHLILATQKPSGVVNDQIWSNSKFRVCLKVQDESDSREMLKRGDAANIKEVGRFFLQVGYDEYFALGQSAWCGAKYYPMDEYIKKINKSVDFIDENGFKIKSIQGSSSKKGPAQGEQLSAIMGALIDLSEQTNVRASKLWLDNIPPVILVDDLFVKYGLSPMKYNVEGIVGEYDAPERQEQGLVKYNYIKDGNSIIYGIDGSEREMLLNSLIYSTTKYHTADEIEFYIIDYGSETFNRYENLPQVGGVVLSNEEEKFNNLLKMISSDIKSRKQLLSKFGGNYESFINQSENKIPLKVIILNNYDSIYESNQKLYDELPELLRDSERYGVVFIFTAASVTSIPNKIVGNCSNKYALKLSDTMDYTNVFDTRVKTSLRNYTGRGFVKHDDIHEFQVASIVDDNNRFNDFINAFVEAQMSMNNAKADKIPTLPEIITFNDIVREDMSLSNIPVGILKENLEVCTYDFTANPGTIATSNKLSNMEGFAKGLLSVFKCLPNSIEIVFDATQTLNLDKSIYPNCYDKDIENVIDKVTEYIKNLKTRDDNICGIVMIYGLNKLLSKVSNDQLQKLVEQVKDYERISLIILETTSKLSQYAYESWYKDNFSTNDGIWIGRGIANQNSIRIATISKEMTLDIPNDMGYVITENIGTLCKLVNDDNGGNENGQ